jgi:hypothetical protein
MFLLSLFLRFISVRIVRVGEHQKRAQKEKAFSIDTAQFLHENIVERCFLLRWRRNEGKSFASLRRFEGKSGETAMIDETMNLAVLWGDRRFVWEIAIQ